MSKSAISGTFLEQNLSFSLKSRIWSFSSFLPQDKVAEFARMSPQQLLRETQRAAGNENLTQWHDTLITAGKDLKAMQEVRASVKSGHLLLNVVDSRI